MLSFSLCLAWPSDFVEENDIRPSISSDPRDAFVTGEGASSFPTTGDVGLGDDFLRSRMKENIPLPLALSLSRSLDLARSAFVNDLDSDSVLSCGGGSREENFNRGPPNFGMVDLDLVEVGDVGRVESDPAMEEGEMGKWDVDDPVGEDARGTPSMFVGMLGRRLPVLPLGLVGELRGSERTEDATSVEMVGAARRSWPSRELAFRV